jgi:Nodulation protein Z (NodZ)
MTRAPTMSSSPRLFFVLGIVMALALGLLQLRFYSMNEISLYLSDMDATVGDLQSRIVASLLLTTSVSSSGAATDDTLGVQNEDATSEPAERGPLLQQHHPQVVPIMAVAKKQKDLRLDRLFVHVSNKTKVRNGVPTLRHTSVKCRAMNAYQRIEKHVVLEQDNQGSNSNSSSSSLAASSVEFIGCCGLGHRLARMAAAAYVSTKLETVLYGDWECCDTTDVFEALFSHDPIILGNFTLRQAHHYPDYNNSSTTTPQYGQPQQSVAAARPHHLQFTYEVPGFDKLGKKRKCPCRPEKIASDYKFFSTLRNRYKRKPDVDAFVAEHFGNKTSIGMHIRAGNGEDGDFHRKGRAIRDQAHFVLNVVQLIQHLMRNVDKNKPPIVFLATDTEHYIEMFRTALSSPNGTFWSNLAMQINNNTQGNETKTIISFPHFQPIPVVHLSQMRPPEGKGVMFGEYYRVASKGDTCMVSQEPI